VSGSAKDAEPNFSRADAINGIAGHPAELSHMTIVARKRMSSPTQVDPTEG